MEIIVAGKGGFCFGVKRAVDMVFKLAEETGKGVYTFGPLIHNPQVINKIIEAGIHPIDDIHSPDIKSLIIRTHGVPPEVYNEVSKMGYKLVDATCPFVKKAQHYAKTLKAEGYQVLIVGDKEHPEVKGLMGFAGDDVVTVNGSEPLPPLKKKVGIIVQTTQRIDTLEKVVLQALSASREIKIYNTICDYTALRVNETTELAKDADLVIVAGGKNSSNTTQLVTLSKKYCKNVYHIETASEVRAEWFEGIEKVVITGGASTPMWIIEEAEKKVREISCGR
ncbi:MAG: 4-hydroxy-3-methylbut-2-enyl diphosphate reductase [Nitrospirae bacterium]|nr:4-hydroxy-3-methylbut-2-enyl diphosphate reductase [Nitrospirota bacterium]